MTQSITAVIHAKNTYSPFKLPVSEGEVYEFNCDGKQRWKDWFHSSSPDGFNNLFARIAGLRVKSAKCFCLCGCYNDQDYNAFIIGTSSTVKMKYSGFISFFANDAKGYYGNNSGSVELEIKKLEAATEMEWIGSENEWQHEI